ncbi:hypothetical protein FOZ61_010794 [Perkinsus olseni]|uniref:Uncharacterized protein n=1 Tax=Perkinsus olseni TaxID=32597 RepID=A0A7J6KW13_PEROL|nr:hypothetical protein FOZ61_010794 [Perkinsus olseni]KAF4658441.1 hypothetical protein FOL46_006964 [Perkinsus olseni]
MGHSGSIPSSSFSFSTSFGHQEVNDPFGNTYSGGGPYAVDLTLPPQSRVARLTRQSSGSSRSLNRGSSDSLLDTRSVGKPTTNAEKDEGSLRRSIAPPSTSREDQTAETREHGHIRGRSEDARSETLSDFLNSSGEHSSPSVSSPSKSSKEEPSTREMQSIVAELPEANSSPVGGVRVMTFDQLELPSDLSSSEAASELEEQAASVHVDVKEATDGGSPLRSPAEKKPSVAAAVGGRGRSPERPPTPEQLPRPATDDPPNSVIREPQELDRESRAADDTIDPAGQRGLPSPKTETRSVEISYADDAFEEESSVFVHDDTFASTDDAAVATAESQLEGFPLHARSQNAQLQDPLRGQQGAPSTTPAAPLGFEPAWNEGSRSMASPRASASSTSPRQWTLIATIFHIVLDSVTVPAPPPTVAHTAAN